ncbi:hypothetical protein CGZ80_25020 [Rhodopirellula sp. MGV]|nr:hypothetical protein CGZ80_25020 [Rhodopirellula sp. MGV]
MSTIVACSPEKGSETSTQEGNTGNDSQVADNKSAVYEIPPDEQMRRAMQAENWKLADQSLRGALISSPNDPDLLTDAAKVAALNNRKREAADLLVQAPKLPTSLPPRELTLRSKP